MFLSKRVRFQGKGNDAGTTLVPVVLVLALAMLITTLIGQQLFYSITLTSQNLASTAAQAGAEGGIDVAKVKIATGTCSSNNFSGSLGKETYQVTIESIQKSGSSWIASCPDVNTAKVRITGVGSALNALGKVGFNHQTITVQEVFDYRIVTSYLNTTVAAGAALQTYGGEGMPGTIAPAPGVSQQEVVLSTGNELCEGTKDVYADVFILSGGVTMGSSCTIHGNLWALGNIRLTGTNSVTGNVYGGADVYVGNNATVGNVYATGTLTMNGSATSVYAGGATSATRSVITGTVTSNLVAVTAFGFMEIASTARIAGRISLLDSVPCTSGCFSTYRSGASTIFPASSTVQSTKLQIGVQSAYAVSFRTVVGTVPFPATPLSGWTSITFSLAQWQTTGFLDVKQLTTSCALNATEMTNIAGKTGPYLIDGITKASGTCASSGITGSLSVALSTDIALVANKFSLSNLVLSSADGLPHNVWLLVPDGPAGGTSGPDCSAPRGSISVSGSIQISPDISVFAYTPCSLRVPFSSIWRGQVIVGNISEESAPSQLIYNTIGIPGYDLQTGVQVPVASYTRSMKLALKRNLN